MCDSTLDPWDEQRLLAIRFAGTTYGLAISLFALVPQKRDAATHLNPFLTSLGIFMLMLGLVGCVLFQFIFIGTKGRAIPKFAYFLLVMIGIGAAGFLSLGLAVMM